MTFVPRWLRPQELCSLWRSRGGPPSFVCVLRGAAGSESLRKTQINADIQALLEAAGQRCVWWYFAEERRFQAGWICVCLLSGLWNGVEMLLFLQQLEKPAHIWSRGGEGPFETVLLLSGTAFLW